MVLLILTGILLLIIACLLFLPISMVINTEQNNYYLTMPGIFKIKLNRSPTSIISVEIKILFFKFRLPSKTKQKTPKRKKEPGVQIKRKQLSIEQVKLLLKNIPQIIRIKILNAEIDTGNFPLNAKLIPLAEVINNNNIQINFNFENRNVINMHVTATIYRMLYALIKIKIPALKRVK